MTPPRLTPKSPERLLYRNSVKGCHAPAPIVRVALTQFLVLHSPGSPSERKMRILFFAHVLLVAFIGTTLGQAAPENVPPSNAKSSASDQAAADTPITAMPFSPSLNL